MSNSIDWELPSAFKKDSVSLPKGIGFQSKKNLTILLFGLLTRLVRASISKGVKLLLVSFKVWSLVLL